MVTQTFDPRFLEFFEAFNLDVKLGIRRCVHDLFEGRSNDHTLLHGTVNILYCISSMSFSNLEGKKYFLIFCSGSTHCVVLDELPLHRRTRDGLYQQILLREFLQGTQLGWSGLSRTPSSPHRYILYIYKVHCELLRSLLYDR